MRDHRTVNPEAYEAYLKGRYFIEQRTEQNLLVGLEALGEAVRLDPTRELAHVGVADAYNLMGFISALAPRATFPHAQAAARQALELNSSSGEAHTSLAYATLWLDWNLEEAERLFRRSIDLNPRYSQAHLWFTNLLLIQERFEEAEDEARTARILDPHSNVAIAFMGWHPYWQGRFGDAHRQLKKAIELIQNFGPGHYWLGLACARRGHDTEALAALGRGAEILGRTPMVLSGLATAHALAGRPTEARALLAETEALAAHRYVGSYYPAQVRVALGDHDAALAGLEAAFEERGHWLRPSTSTPRSRPCGESRASRHWSRASVVGARSDPIQDLNCSQFPHAPS